MLVGYACVADADQSLELQEDALSSAGCEKIIAEIARGAAAARPGLAEALENARTGDTLVVWRLDRLGRSLKDLIETLTKLHARGVGFKSLEEQIDTTTSDGALVFHVLGALAEFQREVLRERTQVGLRAAQARGRKGGRPPSMDATRVAMAKKLLADPSTRVVDVCTALQISRSTLYRHVNRSVTPATAERSPIQKTMDDRRQ